jgi:hypothetical protein
MRSLLRIRDFDGCEREAGWIPGFNWIMTMREGWALKVVVVKDGEQP